MLTTITLAQTSNLIIFSENSNEFTLFVNGVQKNAQLQANVKVENLTSDSYKVRLEFNNKSIPTLNKNIWFETKGMENTYVVKLKNNGKYTLRLVSQTPISQSSGNETFSESNYEDPLNNSVNNSESNIQTESNLTNPTISIVDTDTDISEDASLNINQNSMSMEIKDENGQSTKIDMNINVDPNLSGEIEDENQNKNTNISSDNISLTMNVNINDSENLEESNIGVNSNQSQTFTSSTTITSNGVNTTSNTSNNNDFNTEDQTVLTQNTFSNNDCTSPMDEGEYTSAKTSIKSKSFEDSKFTLAKQIAKANCLSSRQIKEIMQIFDFEDTKLEFAKYAYDYAFDKNNYYKINDAFEFELTIDELNEFLETK